jgi:hypothetical protein
MLLTVFSLTSNWPLRHALEHGKPYWEVDWADCTNRQRNLPQISEKCSSCGHPVELQILIGKMHWIHWLKWTLKVHFWIGFWRWWWKYSLLIMSYRRCWGPCDDHLTETISKGSNIIWTRHRNTLLCTVAHVEKLIAAGGKFHLPCTLYYYEAITIASRSLV